MLTPIQFQDRTDARFADNEYLNITEKSFRDFAADIAQTFVAQAVANVPDYEPGRNYAPGFIIRHDFGGAAPVFLAALAPGGLLPAPTSAAGDASWELSLSPATGQALSQVGTVAALRQVQGDWVPGRLYILINRFDAQGAPLPAVYVRALNESTLELSGYVLSTPPQGVRYNLDTDTATPFSPQLGVVVTQLQALALQAAKRLQIGSYIVADQWNLIYGGVLLTPINVSAFGSIGYIYLSSKSIPVVADLASLTYELLDDYIARVARIGSESPIIILNNSQLYPYDTLAAAAASGKANYSALTITRPVPAAQVQFSTVASLNGGGNTLAGLSDTKRFTISVSTVSNTVFVQATVTCNEAYNCPFSDSVVRGRLINCPIRSGNKFNGIVTLEGSTTVPADFFVPFTKNADGTYSTPDGGTITDKRVASYTDQQARAAQLNQVAVANTTTITLTAESPQFFGTAASGTFTVDGTGCVVGKEAYFDIGPGGTAPLFLNAPASQPFDTTLAKFIVGQFNRYSVGVFPTRIEVIRTK